MRLFTLNHRIAQTALILFAAMFVLNCNEQINRESGSDAAADVDGSSDGSAGIDVDAHSGSDAKSNADGGGDGAVHSDIPVPGCTDLVAVTVSDEEIDCSQPRFLCVDSTSTDTNYYKSIQDAVDEVSAGQVVVVYGSDDETPREYDGFALVGDGDQGRGGTGNAADQRVIIKAVGNVLLRRREAGSIDAPILIQDVDYVTVDGFAIDRSEIGTATSSYDHSGIRVTDTNWRPEGQRASFGIHLVNIAVRYGSPANFYVANVSDVVIERSSFRDADLSDGYDNGGMHLYLANGPADNAVVRCNYFGRGPRMAIHSNGDGDLVEGQLFEYNVFQNVDGHGLHFQDAQRITIRNNVFANIGRTGITAWGITYLPESFIIHNNLFYRTILNLGSPSPVQIGTETYTGDLGNHAIFNNLFVGNVSGGSGTGGNDITVRGAHELTLSNNVDENGNPVTLQAATTAAVEESVFVDYDKGDFSLASAIHRTAVANAGIARTTSPEGEDIVVPALDIAGDPRGTDVVSAGPYEY